MPNGTDKEWLEKMYQNLKERHHFAKPRLSNTAFIVKHFAGEVEYESESFLAKNKDAIVEEHVAILKASKVDKEIGSSYHAFIYLSLSSMNWWGNYLEKKKGAQQRRDQLQ